MNNSPIAFIDSGIGGLPYLKWLKTHAKKESFVYLADAENFPFGTRTREQLIKIMNNTMKFLTEKYQPKAAVIACNTASVISLSSLRENFKIPIVGVVPAIKPAAKITKHRRIGLMASNRTIKDDYTKQLIEEFASDCSIFSYIGTDIIDFIENDYYRSSEVEIKKILKPAVNYFLENKIDVLILGCTHFLLLEKELKHFLGEEVTIIDSREGVGRQVLKILEDNQLLSNKKNKDMFILTGASKLPEKYTKILEKYELCLDL